MFQRIFHEISSIAKTDADSLYRNNVVQFSGQTLQCKTCVFSCYLLGHLTQRACAPNIEIILRKSKVKERTVGTLVKEDVVVPDVTHGNRKSRVFLLTRPGIIGSSCSRQNKRFSIHG